MTLREQIAAEIARRRARATFIPGELLREPAWDLLLDLAANRIDGKKISFSSACLATGAPLATGGRWVRRLLDAGFVEFTPDRVDLRQLLVSLTDAGFDAVAACFGHPTLKAVAA
jgi:hypothetical protein